MVIRIPRVKRGDPITAEWANALADAVDVLQGLTVAPPLEMIRTGSGVALRLAEKDQLLLYNMTGAEIPQWGVVPYSTGRAGLPPDDRPADTHRLFSALSTPPPTWHHPAEGQIAVAQRPIPPSGWGPVQIRGLTQARVRPGAAGAYLRFLFPWPDWDGVTSSDFVLDFDFWGPVRHVYNTLADGVAVVELNAGHSFQFMARIKSTPLSAPLPIVVVETTNGEAYDLRAIPWEKRACLEEDVDVDLYRIGTPVLVLKTIAEAPYVLVPHCCECDSQSGDPSGSGSWSGSGSSGGGGSGSGSGSSGGGGSGSGSGSSSESSEESSSSSGCATGVQCYPCGEMPCEIELSIEETGGGGLCEVLADESGDVLTWNGSTVTPRWIGPCHNETVGFNESWRWVAFVSGGNPCRIILDWRLYSDPACSGVVSSGQGVEIEMQCDPFYGEGVICGGRFTVTLAGL